MKNFYILLALTVCFRIGYAQRISHYYQYDNLSRLTKVVSSTGSEINFVYDEVGNRTGMTITQPCILPSAAGTITGTASVHQSQNGVSYSVPAIALATSYEWTYSGTGVTINNGSTNNITINFAANATAGDLTVYGKNTCGNGTVSENYVINVTGMMIVKRLAAGWTWFSLNVSNTDMSTASVLSNLKSSDGDYIKNQTVSATYYDGTGWFGELTQIDPKEMYKIKLAAVDTLKFEGTPVDPLASPIMIKNGWNWIGYIPQSAKPITQALSTLMPVANDYIKNQTKSSTYYDGTGWFGEMTNLEPLDGYMLKTSHTATLTYPAGEPLKTKDERQKTEDLQTIRPEAFEHSGQVTATVYLNGRNFDAEDYCLYSVVGGQVRGVSRGMWFEPGKEWIHNHLTYSNVNEGDTIRFRLHVAGSGLQVDSDQWYEFDEYVVFSTDMLIANALDPFVLKNSTLLVPRTLSLEPSIEVWPNPASSQATIKFSITTDQTVVIQVFDFSGRIMDELNLGNQPVGEHLKLWNTETLEPGVYYLRMKGAQSVYKQVIITR